LIKRETQKNSDFYNTLCPEITMTTTDGNVIHLDDMIGNVIIIKFSRFYKKDLSSLVYLDHMFNKFKKYGVYLFFVHSYGEYDENKIRKICHLYAPVVNDFGRISYSLNSAPDDIIIIGRDFRIKFKLSTSINFDKPLVYREVLKWISNETSFQSLEDSPEFFSKMNYIFYEDVFKNKEYNLANQIRRKKTILTLYTSICAGCDEGLRIELLKEFTLRNKDNNVIILFGKGNNKYVIKQFAYLNNWNEYPFSIGVIKPIASDVEEDYYSLFNLEVDPRTFIINKNGKVIFAESLRNSKKLNPEFLKKAK